MAATKMLLTAEDLEQMPDDGRWYELLDGELVALTPPGGYHNGVMGNLYVALRSYVQAHDLGIVFAGDPGVILRRNPDRVRAPDVCFFTRERMPPGSVPVGYFEVIPDFVAEVISPHDRAGDVEQKTQEWLQAGVRLVWLVYPQSRSIVAYNDPSEARRFGETDTIDGAPVLPDFRLAVRDLFP